MPEEPDQPVGSLRVLFVCTANICRSPAIELLARHAAPDEQVLVFGSAGTHAVDGAAMDQTVAAALPAYVDASGLRSRRLTTGLLHDADLVLTMETAHRSLILDEHPDVVRKVFTVGQFAHSVARAPEGLGRAGLLDRVATSRGAADPALDVPDPYARGPAAASACVARLEDLVRTLLPALAR